MPTVAIKPVVAKKPRGGSHRNITPRVKSARKHPVKPFCLNCNRPRNLCFKCYGNPSIRKRFKTLGKFGRRSSVASFGERMPAPFPTKARPGTDAKVSIMAERAASGFEIWHPQDAGFSDGMDAALVSEVLRDRGTMPTASASQRSGPGMAGGN